MLCGKYYYCRKYGRHIYFFFKISSIYLLCAFLHINEYNTYSVTYSAPQLHFWYTPFMHFSHIIENNKSDKYVFCFFLLELVSLLFCGLLKYKKIVQYTFFVHIYILPNTIQAIQATIATIAFLIHTFYAFYAFFTYYRKQ